MKPALSIRANSQNRSGSPNSCSSACRIGFSGKNQIYRIKLITHNFDLRRFHLVPGIGREVFLEVNGCRKCSRHHLMNSRTIFSHSFEVELAKINARLLSKLSACVTEIKTSSRFECWRQHKLLNPSFACLPAYQDIQKAILH